ncbi:MAG: FapA family protein, partial [Planctomycetota bacterium]
MSAADFSKSIAIRFASGGLEALLTLRAGLTAEERTFEYIRSAVLASGVVPRRIDEDALRDAVDAYDLAEGSPEQLIATGEAAEPASPVRVELRDDILAELEAAEALRRMADGSAPPDELAPDDAIETPDEVVDRDAECDGLAQSHYNRSAFVVVEAGRALGRLVPAFEGKDGEDVTGAVIQAKPLTAKTYEPDDTVQVDAEGLISARVPGLLDVTGAGPIVRDTLDIDSDVDFSTGNIDFPGDVNIARGVRDLFQVRVGGSLHTGDVIEAATIEVQRHATLAVGMAGRGKGSITVGRDLEARYLDDVDVHVGGNLRIDRELSNCRIEVQGALEAPKCRVVGGEVRVVGRCEVAQAGSPRGRTHGPHPRSHPRVRDHRRTIHRDAR